MSASDASVCVCVDECAMGESVDAGNATDSAIRAGYHSVQGQAKQCVHVTQIIEEISVLLLDQLAGRGSSRGDDGCQLSRGVVYTDSIGVVGDSADGVPKECDAADADGGRECRKDQRCGSSSPSVVDMDVDVNSVGASLKWLIVGIGENSDSVVGVVGVYAGLGLPGRS